MPLAFGGGAGHRENVGLVPTVEVRGVLCGGTVQGPHLTVPGELVWAVSAAQGISHPAAGEYAVGAGGTVA